MIGEKKPLPSFSPLEGVQNRRILVTSSILLIIFLSLFAMQDTLGLPTEAVALGCAVLALAKNEEDKRIVEEKLSMMERFGLIKIERNRIIIKER